VSPIAVVGFTALGLLVVLWLVVSFTRPGPRRDVLEWSGALCLYVALCMLFLNLVRRAVESGNTIALVAFGFLGVVFVLGGCVSLVNLFRSLTGSGGDKPQTSATN
jgi:hypothetical protein